MVTEAKVSNYWIANNAIYIERNALGEPNYIQGNVNSGAYILCYIKGIEGLEYDAGHNYQRWQLSLSPSVFPDNKHRYVYVAIPRVHKSDNDIAIVCFPSEKIDVYGKEIKENKLEDGSTELVSGDQIGSIDYYYIFLQGELSASETEDGVIVNREWVSDIEFGTLASDESIAAGGESAWWQYNSVSDTISFVKTILNATFENLSAKILNLKTLVFGEKEIIGVADEKTEVDCDNKIVTPAYLNNYAGSQYLSKINDDAAHGIITFLRGMLIGDGSHSISEDGNAILGDVVVDRIHDAASTPSERVIIGAQGFDLYMGDDGKAHLYLDDLIVRRRFFASSAEIRKISYSGGTTIFSNAGSTLAKVSAVFDSNGNCVAYKCYACADDGTTKTMNWWHVGMMALCQTFNVKAGKTENLQNRYYWRLVVGVGQETLEDGKLYDYVVLSNKEKFLGSDSYVPTYTDKVIADENEDMLVFGDYGMEVTTDGGMGSMAGVFFEQEGLDSDDGGNKIANRYFYGYEAVDGLAPDAPAAGDVIVQVGDQIRWKSRGNLIKMSTSTEDNATDNAPAITMYHNLGALYATGKKDSDGNAIVSPYQWKTCTAVISPEMVKFNSNNFAWFSDNPDEIISPITVMYSIETSGMFRVGSEGKLTGDNIYSGNSSTRYVIATCYKSMGSSKEIVEKCWWEVSYKNLYVTSPYVGSTSVVMSNGDVADAPAYVTASCYTIAVSEDGTLMRGDTLLASVDIPVIRDGGKGEDGNTIKIASTSVSYARSTTNMMPDKDDDSLWQDTMPSVDEGDWLWTRTVVLYSDKTRLISVSVSRIGKDGTSVRIKSTEVVYKLTKTSEQPSEFDSSFPTYLTKGWYLWTKTIVVYDDGNSTESLSVSHIGDDGKQGFPGSNGKTTHFAYADYVAYENGNVVDVIGFSTTLKSTSEYIGTYDDETLDDSENWKDYSWTKLKGEQGDPGSDGVGIKSADVMYCISSSDTAAPADNANWKTLFTELSLSDGKFVWTCTKVVYTKGNPTYSGKQCLGKCEDFATVTEQYAIGTSSTDAPTSGWGTSYVPTKERWLWTRSEIVWTDDSKTYTEAVCVSYFGKDGENGKNGDYTEYYFAISAYKSTLSPLIYPVDIMSWSATAIAPTTAKPYVWMRIAKFSNGAIVSTSYVRVTGEDGNDGKPGAYTVYDYKISVLNTSDSPTVEPEPAACYPEEWQDSPLEVTAQYPYLWMRMTRKNDPNDDSVTYVCLTGEKGEQGDPGDDGQSALDIVVAPSTLVFNSDEDGLVPSSTSKSATILCYRKGVLVKDAVFTIYSTLGCSATISKNASGTCSVAISNIKTQTIDETTTVSVTSGYARVKILDELGNTSYAQVNFAVDVAKFTGQMVMDNKTFRTNFEEITNRFEDTDSAIGDISGKYDDLPDDVKTSGAFKKYTSSIEQTARKISLSVSEKAVGRRNLLVGSEFKRFDSDNMTSNGQTLACRLRTGDQVDGYNSCRIVSDSTSYSYNGVVFKNIAVNANTTYTLTTWAKRMSESLGAGCVAIVYEKKVFDGAAVNQQSWVLLSDAKDSNGNYIDAIDEWKLKTRSFTTQGTTRYINIIFCARTYGKFAVCKPILEEGDSYNGYSKSEKDYGYIGGNMIDNSRDLTVGGTLVGVGGTVQKTQSDDYANTTVTASGNASVGVFSIKKTLKAGVDYVLSWYIRRTSSGENGQCTVNLGRKILYSELHTGKQAVNSVEGGSSPYSGYQSIYPVPVEWTRMWVHFRLSEDWTDTDNQFYIQLYKGTADSITAQLSRPKLEEGAYPTEWTDNPNTYVEEGSIANKLFASGMDIENGEITLTADKTKFRNNSGTVMGMFEDDRLKADLVDADTIVANGIKTQELEAQNLNVTGNSKFGIWKVGTDSNWGSVIQANGTFSIGGVSYGSSSGIMYCPMFIRGGSTMSAYMRVGPHCTEFGYLYASSRYQGVWHGQAAKWVCNGATNSWKLPTDYTYNTSYNPVTYVYAEKEGKNDPAVVINVSQKGTAGTYTALETNGAVRSVIAPRIQTASSSQQIQGTVSMVICTNTSEITLTLPKYPVEGQMLFIVQRYAHKVIISRNSYDGAYIRNFDSATNQTSVSSNTVNQISMFIFDGTYWVGSFLSGTL